MKKSLLLLVLVSFTILGMAQEKEQKEIADKSKMTHELSVNATFFIKQFLNFSNSNIATSPYAVSYKMITPKNHALRTGLGMNISNTNNPAEDEDDNDVKTSDLQLDWRVGYEKQIPIGKKVLFFGGVDVMNSINKQNVESTFTDFIFNPGGPSTEIESTSKTTVSATGFGAGPVLGFQINFTDRIGLYTESALIFKHTIQNSKRTIADFPDLDSEDKSSQTELDFFLPTSLYFAVRF